MNEDEILYSLDISGSSINKYGTIFKLNYTNEFSKNHEFSNASNKKKIKLNLPNKQELRLSKSNTEVYYLECLEILKLDLWNNCFIYNSEKEKVEVNYAYFVDICCDIQRCFKGTLNYTGKNFTQESLIAGDFDIYYMQYMAYKMFGTNLAIYGIQNLNNIKDNLSSIPKRFMGLLQQESFLERLKQNYIERQNIFQKGDILEFSIFMKEPNLKLLSQTESSTKKYNNMEKKYKIGNSIWNIYFIIL